MKKRVICVVMSMMITLLVAMPIGAATISDVKNQQSNTKNKLDSVNKNINDIVNKKNNTNAEINELDSQLVDLLVVVGVLQDDIVTKEKEIDKADEDFQAAKLQEEAQYDAMKRRIRFMYEKGDSMYLELFLQAKSITDLVNKVDYAGKLYQYDRDLLISYQKIKEEVKALEDRLIQEKLEMEDLEAEYIIEQVALKDMIDSKQTNIANFNQQLNNAKVEAQAYQNELKVQSAVIKQMEEVRRLAEEAEKKRLIEEAKKLEEARKQAEALEKAQNSANTNKGNNTANSSTANNTGSVAPPSESNNASSPEVSAPAPTKPPVIPPAAGNSGGGGSGQTIADFGCQFIGKPYVAGGTSLTEGADCSGFTQTVFSNFGISIPRTSGSQALGGVSVSYDEAQAGDIVCYAGHVGIYIGGGRIVHASTPATGIKITNATYRTIIAVRRYY